MEINPCNQTNLLAQLEASNYVITDPRFYTDSVEDYDYRLQIEEAYRIDQFVSEVLKSNQPGFKLNKITRVRNDLVFFKDEFQTLPLATSYFRHVMGMYYALLPSYSFYPYIDLFKRCIEKLELQSEFLNVPQAMSLRSGKPEYELFNDLVALIRQESQTREFKQTIMHFKDNLKRGLESGQEFINYIFEKYKRILVVRVDLGYKKVCARSVSIEHAKDDMTRFLNKLRLKGDLSKSMVAYIWRWEFGFYKGHHAHCLFLFNGDLAWKDDHWGKMLGKYWDDVIAPGRGHYWNVNQGERKAEYERKGLLGIGMVHRDDTSMRDNLINYVLQYFFKDEQHVLAKENNKSSGRLFGKGIL